MRVLVACEFSGTVRDAFARRGHDAWSCDLLPSEKPGQHIRGDVLRLFNDKYGCANCNGDGCEMCDPWDLMIAHPPCTHLAVSGAKHFAEKRADGRQQEAIDFFMDLARAPVPRIAIENPVGIMSSAWREPDQIVQPYHFGDEHTKTTCLWLKGLRCLDYDAPLFAAPTVVGKGRRHVTKSGKSLPEWYNLPPSPDRARIRSATFKGMAEAMAEQWGALQEGFTP